MSSTLRFDTWQDSDGNNRVSGFNASSTITATDATWAVPDLGSPWVKVTVIGGGGGGGGAGTGQNSGGNGGTTTFDAGGAGTVTAGGGLGGLVGNAVSAGRASSGRFVSANNGGGGSNRSSTDFGQHGMGGVITVSYLNLTGISTVNVTIGAGGSAGPGSLGGTAGSAGVVIVEYVAA